MTTARARSEIWRLAVWTALGVVMVATTSGSTRRVVAGVALGVAVLALRVDVSAGLTVRRVAVVVTTVGGLVAFLAAPVGVGAVAVLAVLRRVPDVFDGAALRWFVVLDTIAFAAAVGVISRSVPALLAGVAVPLLVQRGVERRDLVREKDRAEALLAQVQAGREAEAQAAALRERGRIARDLHDVLAHSLAGLSVQLQAARAIALRRGVGEEVLEPLDRAAALAREGLDEARQAVSALRDPGGLGLDDLPALVERHAGRAVLTSQGEARPVEPGVEYVVYRAVQEALTNAIRYAPGSTVQVALSWGGDALRVGVTDSGPAPDRTPVAEQGTGLGLAGMGERVREVGGTVQAGPRPSGGWQVQVEVPLAPSAVLPSKVAEGSAR